MSDEKELNEQTDVSKPADGQLPIYVVVEGKSLNKLVEQMNQRAKEGYRVVGELQIVERPTPHTSVWAVVMELQEPVAPYIPEIKLALMLYNGEVEVEVENASPINGFEA